MWLGAAASATAAVDLLSRGSRTGRHAPEPLGVGLALAAVGLLFHAAWWTRRPIYEFDVRGFSVRAWPWEPAFTAPWGDLAWHAVDAARMAIHIALADGRSRRCPLRMLTERGREVLIAQFDAHAPPTRRRRTEG